MNWAYKTADASFCYLMHQTKDLILRDCNIDLTSANLKVSETNLERLTVSNTTLQMPQLRDTN